MAMSSSWRGSVGLIKPTRRGGGIEEFCRLLPEGIGVLPLFLNVRKGTMEEFSSLVDAYTEKIGELAESHVDLIHAEGAPPLVVHGLAGERKIVDGWERAHGIPICTSASTQVEALKALGVRRIVGVSYLTSDVNDTFTRYFRDAGFDVLAMEGMDVPFDEVQRLSSREIYAFTRRVFLEHPGGDGIYMLWRCLDIIELLEQDLGVPVVHAVPARIWAIAQKLHVREPRQGYGRLLAEIPPLPAPLLAR